jgi:hypothetical protein
VSATFQLLVAAVILAATASASAASPSSAPQAALASANESEALQEVTVTAQHFQLAQRVSKFVYQIAALENAEGLPRWRKGICPQVTGLPREAGEFILGRISEIARAAGAPLGAENCGPNLFIVVTPDPKRVLEGMNIQTRLLTFAGAHPGVIDEFIATPRPIRVWYKTGMATPEGIPLGDSDRTDTMEAIYGRFPAVSAESSYVKRNIIWSFTRLLVVVDRRQLQGLSRGQFADYIAMVTLADLKPGAHLGDAPTILKLFDGTPAAAPVGMSEWDLAFLRSLYSTDQTSKGQRGQIAHTIERELSH